ncbi:MAG: adenylate/guanylate cyclase domain-containing protein [Acholeplasma sp.]|nr:adenylate/guanylate cyclase domain-containing protein [Acholeplasma sp.]
MNKDLILEKIGLILNEKKDEVNIKRIPRLDDVELAFGMDNESFVGICVSCKLNGLDAILNEYGNLETFKISKALIMTISEVASNYGGELRSFSNDSVLLLFNDNTDKVVEKAVTAAMIIKYLLVVHEQSLIKRVEDKYYHTLDLGIGIDMGNILAGKIDNDFIWIGRAIDIASLIAKSCKTNDNIGVSKEIYEILTDEVKFDGEINMWKHSILKYNKKNERIYKTIYHTEI